MIKIYLNEDGSIAKYEPVKYKEIIVDKFDATDSLVVCDETKEICKIQDSSQGKRRVKELQDKKELDEIEKAELEFLLS